MGVPYGIIDKRHKNEQQEISIMFKQCDRETIYLFPPSVQEWLPEGHLARFVVEIVDQLNLDRLKRIFFLKTTRNSICCNDLKAISNFKKMATILP